MGRYLDLDMAKLWKSVKRLRDKDHSKIITAITKSSNNIVMN